MVKRHIGWLFVTIGVMVDIFLISMSVTLAWWVRYVLGIGGAVDEPNFLPLANYGWLQLALPMVMLLAFAVSGVYRSARGHGFRVETAHVVQGILSALGLLVIALFLTRFAVSSRLILIYAGLISTLLLLSARLIKHVVKRSIWRRGIGVVRVLVVGDGLAARELMAELLRCNGNGRRLWGCLAIDPEQTGEAIVIERGGAVAVPVLGTLPDLETVMYEHDIRHVIIALPGAAVDATDRAVRICTRRHVDFRVAPELYGVAGHQVTIDSTYSRPVLQLSESSLGERRKRAKRALDITLSLLVLAPIGLLVMAVLAMLIKLDSHGPIFFKQRRLTRDGSIFWVYKFRSMYTDAEDRLALVEAQNEIKGHMFKMKDDPRITRVGKLLRRASLDELPQVFNILMGEMSWVGPRPPLPREVEQYEDWQKRRLGTVTGLTGLWQVSGRSLLSFEEMVKLDLYYVENWSIWLDLKILFMTIPSVVTAKGAY